MDNHHNHNHSHSSGSKNIAYAFFLNLFFAIVELVGGVWTNSMAILSDALHDFGDCLSLGVAWGLQKKSLNGRDDKYSYGYKRFSLLGSVFLSGVLTVSSVFILIEAVKRLFEPQQVYAQGMLWMAVFGVIVNGIAAFRLVKGHSFNERAVFLHMMEDFLGWIGVLVVSIVMVFIDLPILDPILSIAISIWMLLNVYKNLKGTFIVFLQGVPSGLDIAELKIKILNIGGVDSIHDLHIWTLDGESHIMTLHIVIEEGINQQDKNSIKNSLSKIGKQYGISHTTVEYEVAGDMCSGSCD